MGFIKSCRYCNQGKKNTYNNVDVFQLRYVFRSDLSFPMVWQRRHFDDEAAPALHTRSIIETTRTAKRVDEINLPLFDILKDALRWDETKIRWITLVQSYFNASANWTGPFVFHFSLGIITREVPSEDGHLACTGSIYIWYHMTIANIYSLHNDLDCHVEAATAKHWYNGSDWVETIDKGQVHSAFRHAKDRGQSSRQQKTPKRDGIAEVYWSSTSHCSHGLFVPMYRVPKFPPFFDMQRTQAR